MGFKGFWHEGWLLYDGTIVMLFAHPSFEGNAYYTCKANYGLNLQVSQSVFSQAFSDLKQVGNVPSTLRVVDYSHGLTGAAHDAAAFEHTAASAGIQNTFFLVGSLHGQTQLIP